MTTNYAELLKRWIILKNEGFSFPRLFKKNGWNRIAIYGAGTLGEALFSEIYNEIEVRYFIDMRAHKELHKFNGVDVINSTESGLCDGLDVIIVALTEKLTEIKYLLQARTNVRIISILDLMDKLEYEEAFSELSKFLVNKGVSFYLFSMPSVRKIKNPSLLEKSLFGFSDTKFNQRYEFFKELLSDIDYFTKEYFDEITEGFIFTDNAPERECTLMNVNGQFLNIINGKRYVPDLPEKYENTIYSFGHCYNFGRCAEDKYTIGNRLQMKINESNLSYGVVTYANRIININYLYKEKIAQLPLKRGDIVLFYNDAVYNALTGYSFENINACTLSPFLDRPHNMGEVFYNDSHVTYKAYTLIADGIFNILFNSAGRDNVNAEENKFLLAPPKTDTGNISFASKTVEAENAAGVYGANDDLLKYLDFLKTEKADASGKKGAIVMNCNPFTLGHKYVVEAAAEEVDFLYLFVVEEDKSVFPFADRIALVKKGVEHIDNVKVLPSGRFIISTVTLPEYFSKEDMPFVEIDASNDLKIFASQIAPVLDISVRFAGSEPFCKITKQYNRDMREILPSYGIEFKEMERTARNGVAISASQVRKLINENRMEEVEDLVPHSTFDYLVEFRGK